MSTPRCHNCGDAPNAEGIVCDGCVHRRCDWCGQAFRVRQRAGRPRLSCSEACARALHRLSRREHKRRADAAKRAGIVRVPPPPPRCDCGRLATVRVKDPERRACERCAELERQHYIDPDLVAAAIDPRRSASDVAEAFGVSTRQVQRLRARYADRWASAQEAAA